MSAYDSSSSFDTWSQDSSRDKRSPPVTDAPAGPPAYVDVVDTTGAAPGDTVAMIAAMRLRLDAADARALAQDTEIDKLRRAIPSPTKPTAPADDTAGDEAPTYDEADEMVVAAPAPPQFAPLPRPCAVERREHKIRFTVDPAAIRKGRPAVWKFASKRDLAAFVAPASACTDSGVTSFMQHTMKHAIVVYATFTDVESSARFNIGVRFTNGRKQNVFNPSLCCIRGHVYSFVYHPLMPGTKFCGPQPDTLEFELPEMDIPAALAFVEPGTSLAEISGLVGRADPVATYVDIKSPVFKLHAEGRPDVRQDIVDLKAMKKYDYAMRTKNYNALFGAISAAYEQEYPQTDLRGFAMHIYRLDGEAWDAPYSEFAPPPKEPFSFEGTLKVGFLRLG